VKARGNLRPAALGSFCLKQGTTVTYMKNVGSQEHENRDYYDFYKLLF